MKTCPHCGTILEDELSFCTACGTHLDDAPGQLPEAAASAAADDLAENKLFAILAYVGSLLGIIVALLAAPDSPFVRFHVQQAVKLTICEALLVLAMAVLCWTVIVPVAGGIALCVLFVVEIICIVNVCRGRMTEAPIVKNIGFLK